MPNNSVIKQQKKVFQDFWQKKEAHRQYILSGKTRQQD